MSHENVEYAEFCKTVNLDMIVEIRGKCYRATDNHPGLNPGFLWVEFTEDDIRICRESKVIVVSDNA